MIGARMIKVTGGGGVGGAGRARGASSTRASSSGGFRVEGAATPSTAQGSAPAGETASAAALGALIALQGEGRRSARNRAAAERLLVLLERLRDGLAAGRVAVSDLEAIANAALAKLDDPDERIAAIYEEIALRARVELAKIGRA